MMIERRITMIKTQIKGNKIEKIEKGGCGLFACYIVSYIMPYIVACLRRIGSLLDIVYKSNFDD